MNLPSLALKSLLSLNSAQAQEPTTAETHRMSWEEVDDQDNFRDVSETTGAALLALLASLGIALRPRLHGGIYFPTKQDLSSCSRPSTREESRIGSGMELDDSDALSSKQVSMAKVSLSHAGFGRRELTLSDLDDTFPPITVRAHWGLSGPMTINGVPIDTSVRGATDHFLSEEQYRPSILFQPRHGALFPSRRMAPAIVARAQLGVVDAFPDENMFNFQGVPLSVEGGNEWFGH